MVNVMNLRQRLGYPRRDIKVRRAAFTLLELLVVITIILIMLALVVPAFLVMAKNAARIEAYHTFSTAVQLARIEATNTLQFVGLHIQPTVNSDLGGQQFGMLVTGKQDSGFATKYDFASGKIEDRAKIWKSNEWIGANVVILAGANSDEDTPIGQVTGNTSYELLFDSLTSIDITEDGCPYRINPSFSPITGGNTFKIPKGFVFAQLDGCVNSDGSYDAEQLDTEDQLNDMFTFTVLFAPTGRLVVYPMQSNIKFNKTSSAFVGDSQIWDYELTNDPTTSDNGEPGVKGVVMIEDEPGGFRNMNKNARANFLNESGRFLPVNSYTGEILDRR